MTRYIFVLIIFGLISCSKDDKPEPESSIYFPPLNSDTWETETPESLNWNVSAANDLFDFLSDNDTRAFIILKDGKIVIEKYWGNNILNSAPFDKNTNWYWASAGKTLTAFLIGLAQEDGFLNINNKTSDYLGKNWTSLPIEKEDLILVKHQLSMTTGLDYRVENLDCTDADCLKYKADAGTQWYYHNAPYTLLETVISNSSKMTFNKYTDERIEAKIGMSGNWLPLGDNNVYWSTARDAARFGLLMLAEGRWGQAQIMKDLNYFHAMISSSQNLNPSYGYLCWLNGKSSVILPGLAVALNVPVSTNAPSDLFAAMGKNGQFINVVPGKKLVVIRMGDAPDNALVPVLFHDEMWLKINAVIN